MTGTRPVPSKGAAAVGAAEAAIAKTLGDCYRPTMVDTLNALLARLKAHQRDLILDMAKGDGIPATNALRQVAELENVIAAVEAVAAEESE